MVKFLSGTQYSGTTVPLCAFWRNDFRTDTSKEIAELESTGQAFAQRGKGKDSAIGDFAGQCIANAFFGKSTISCFNDGDCNGEGKCLPCTKYRSGGMRLAITHSPPIEALRFFNRGLTETQIQSPNLIRFPPDAVNAIEQDQLPYHILLRNIQAEVAKCCHWNEGDGAASRFFLATIQGGPDSVTVTDANGRPVSITGIRVKNSEFPDEVGTFFPRGTVVVAGFEDQPSFYLEPRTGLVKPGEDIIFNFASGTGVDSSPSTVITKQIASNTNALVINAVNAATLSCQEAQRLFQRDTDFFNNALNTQDTNTIAAAQDKLTTATTNQTTACDAATLAATQGQDAINLIAAVIQADNRTTLEEQAKLLAAKLVELANTVETAGGAVGGTSIADQTAATVRLLRVQERQLRFSANGGVSKCAFFFDSNNIAQKWNSPADGSLICNGVRTDCDFYTGKAWQFATDEKMELGRPILAEQIQEVRFRSDDWTRFTNPEEEFKNRFTTPFIWAFKEYVDVSGTPSLEDMLLYRPKVLFSLDENRNTVSNSVRPTFETIRVEKVRIADFENLRIEKSQSNIRPGSDTLDQSRAPQFPTQVAEPSVSSVVRLKISHPEPDQTFIYRIWDASKNKISLFGQASPVQTIYIINETALRNRLRYHVQFGTKNFFEVPTALPKSPDFVGLKGSELLAVVDLLAKEKSTNQSLAPLGFHETVSSIDGFWQSIQEVDLVHNAVNNIFIFLIANEDAVLVAKATVDCRLLHAFPVQTTFEGTDFSIVDTAGSSKLGSNTQDTVSTGKITADIRQLLGKSRETVQFGYGYHSWRFRDRGLKFGILNADNDLQGQNPVADSASSLLVTTAAPSEFVVNTSSHVVRYRKSDVVLTSDDWILLDDCGRILVKIPDKEIHRVLPLPNQAGNFVSIPGILINGGGTGGEIAQWGIESAELRTVTGNKRLVQFYRDPDGFGLPANYVILGPDFNDSSGQNAFGRPDPDSDRIFLTYTFLRAQTGRNTNDEANTDLGINESDPGLGTGQAEVVSNNFYNDSIRTHGHRFSFESSGILAAGGDDAEAIADDQQDYVYVFSDSEGRPIGKKYTRFYVTYYNFSAISIEIFYRWASSCTTYALLPDFFTNVGNAGGRLGQQPDATSDPDDDRLTFGFRIKNLLGDRDCTNTPNCGDHSFVRFAILRKEFEVIVREGETDADGQPVLGEDGQQATILKAVFPNAGGKITGELISSERPGSQVLRKHGPLWYPYTTCERPRYNFVTSGPLRTDSSELINTELSPPGLVSGGSVVFDGNTGTGSQQNPNQTGVFGGLLSQSDEAYRGPDRVSPKILDIHPDIRLCISAYTYGNQILKSGENRFVGYARKRGIIDTFLYEAFQWNGPPFGNFARPRLVFEISNERGDFLGGNTGKVQGFRWMPMFPTRNNIGSTINLFQEGNDGLPEPQSYRLTAVSSPLGAIDEAVKEEQQSGGFTLSSPRFTHKALIVNKVAAAIEFPFSPFFPMFLQDTDIGKEPEDGSRAAVEEASTIGEITSMWAWREQDKPIRRGAVGPSILQGVKLDVPDYFIDNRRLEVRLRPPEGNHVLQWESPEYDDTGELTKNATIRLGLDGPKREIIIDFINKKFELAVQTDTVYDSSKQLGDTPFPCVEDTPTDNKQLVSKCSCITNVSDPALEGSESDAARLPSRVLHLDEIAPNGFAALYVSTELQTPFAIDIGRTRSTQPCCQCIYYIPGIFFNINPDLIPAEIGLNPANDSRLGFKYTWSRPPHGIPINLDDPSGNLFGLDGRFNGIETLADNLLSHQDGEVFTNSPRPSQTPLDLLNDGGAFFPSTLAATTATLDGAGIVVRGPLAQNVIKFGGRKVDNDNKSVGEDEDIILSMVFPTYVRINQVDIDFYAGNGLEAPRFIVAVVPTGNRTNDKITLNIGRQVGQAASGAVDGNVPNSQFLDRGDINAGRARFKSSTATALSNLPFWEQYGQEWQIIFPRRGNAQSMGIFSITMQVDALVNGIQTTEVIQVRERKYYKSEGAIPGGLNPERFLQEVDSATAYWRGTEKGAFKGSNRHRAYAWGDQIEDTQAPILGEIDELEGLQLKEYDKARSLMGAPYSFSFKSFIPLDERTWVELFSEALPEWTFVSTNIISELKDVKLRGSGNLVYGAIPERTPFNPPGHVWVHTLKDRDVTFLPCCIGCPDQQIVDYEFLHLHDNLALVETAGFWSELPSGLTRLIRSTMLLPDPAFGVGGGPGDVALINAADFSDPQGNPVPAEVLEASGFTLADDGETVYIDNSTPGS